MELIFKISSIFVFIIYLEKYFEIIHKAKHAQFSKKFLLFC